MKIELDLDAIVTSALTTALAPERLQTLIETQVAKVADEAIKSAFSTYSAFSKTVETALKPLVPHELSLDGGAKWNHIIRSVIEQRVAAYNEERMTQVMKPMLDELLETPPAELKLSELVAKAVEEWGDNYGAPRHGQPTVIVRQSTGSTAGYVHIRMDPEKDTSEYSCQVSMDVTPEGKVYSIKVNGQDVQKTRFAGPFFNFDAYLFQLYTGGTKLVIDAEDFSDVYYPGSDD